MATPESIEAEFAQSEYAELLAILKKSFSAEYDDLIATAVRRRNEGASDQAFGQELAERFQNIMRGKLKPRPTMAMVWNAIDATTATCMLATSPNFSSRKSENETSASCEGCPNCMSRNCRSYFPA